MKGLLIWLWLAQGADVGTTVAALHKGCVESTYWSGRPTVIRDRQDRRHRHVDVWRAAQRRQAKDW